MNILTTRSFPFTAGILFLTLLCLTAVPLPALADNTGQDGISEAAAELVTSGVDAQFVDAAIEKARTAGLSADQIEDMLDDLEDAYRESSGKDLDSIVDSYLSGTRSGDEDDGELEEDDLDDDDQGGDGDADDGEDQDHDEGDGGGDHDGGDGGGDHDGGEGGGDHDGGEGRGHDD